MIINGLRSNIMNLRLRDFEECRFIDGYEGHKIISNDHYKILIYREKKIYCYHGETHYLSKL